MKNRQTNFLLILFGTSSSLALIGLTSALFGGIKEIAWLLYSGVVLAMFSIVLSAYANRMLNKILNENYNRLTKRIDSKFEEARNTLNRIYSRKDRQTNGQNTNPGSSPEQ